MPKIKPLYDGIKLSCTIVADTHIDIRHPMPYLPKRLLKNVLRDAVNSSDTLDAVIVIGDTVSRGNEINWNLARECFSKYPFKKTILALGNHDTWNDDGYDAAINEYKKAYEDICGKKRDKVYFSEDLNSYRMIFLGSEYEGGCEANFSDEQLMWLDSELADGTKDSKPVFVFCHQSLNGKHGLPMTSDRDGTMDLPPEEGGVGEKSEEIENILKKYKNVFYFSGHSHMGLCGEKSLRQYGFSSFENEGNIEYINLPSLACGNHHGEIGGNCIGVQLEVYDKKVVLRPRSYHFDTYLEKVNIRNGRPYLEKEII